MLCLFFCFEDNFVFCEFEEMGELLVFFECVNYYNGFVLGYYEFFLICFDLIDWLRSCYFIDFVEYLCFFLVDLKVIIFFGDVIYVLFVLSVFKSWLIDGNNVNLVLFKFDKFWYFWLFDDLVLFFKKVLRVVWCGSLNNLLCVVFVFSYVNSVFCDVGYVS